MGKVTEINKQLSLVNSIKKNDPAVLKSLYQENFPKVQIFILKNNGTMPQAKDLYQEAFLAMYQNIKANRFVPKNETALQGYLYTIAKNKWRDHLRSSEYKNTAHLDSETPMTGTANQDSDLRDPIEMDTRMESTMRAFRKLGDECKKLLEVFYFQKKSMNDIAQLYNIGAASARNKKYRCIQKLRTLTLSPDL